MPFSTSPFSLSEYLSPMATIAPSAASVAPVAPVVPGAPTRLSELLAETRAAYTSAIARLPATLDDDAEPARPIAMADLLLNVLRKYHYWPSIQVKKFYDRSGLTLVHNTYKRIDVSAYQDLYDECRSVVLDLNAPEGENVVMTLSNGIPCRLTDMQYEAMLAAPPAPDAADVPAAEKRLEVSYEGTTVYVYHHKGRWYFDTSSCPTVDNSRYFHPTKTHGEMLNECLARLTLPNLATAEETADSPVGTAELRGTFASHLNPEKTYVFLLVHHQNRRATDYTTEFGSADYAVLVHIQTRSRAALEDEEDVPVTRPLAHLGVRYPKILPTPADGLAYLRETPAAYGVVLKGKAANGLPMLTIVSREQTVTREEYDLANPNVWHNMLWVYMQNKPHYHIDDYLADYTSSPLHLPKDSNGRDMDPTYVIHTVLCTMRDILHGLYVSTTKYYPQHRRFKMSREADGTLPPMLRFHLAQLRHIQITHHTASLITPKAVFHYLCHIQTLKNVRTLIRFFANNPGHRMTSRQAECFGALEHALSE